MMEKYKTAFMPRDKKYTVTNRAQIPQVAALACHDKNKSGASRSSSLYYALKVILWQEKMQLSPMELYDFLSFVFCVTICVVALKAK